MSFRIVMQRRNKTSLVESELLNLVLLKRLSHCILYQQFRDTSKKQTKTRLQPSLEFLFPHRLSYSIQSCLVKLYCWDNIFRRGKSNTKPRRLWARQSLLRSHTQKRYSQYLSQKKLHETAQEIETFGKQIEKNGRPFQASLLHLDETRSQSYCTAVFVSKDRFQRKYKYLRVQSFWMYLHRQESTTTLLRSKIARSFSR